jgi:dienelactone hydrolase
MRTLEWFIVAVLLPAIVYSSMPHRPNWTVWLAIVALLLVLMHAFSEGMHWQMVPAYAATGVLVGTIVAPPSLSVFCSIVAGALLTASLALSWCLPMFRLPRPTGKYPVGTRRLHVIDPDRMEMHAGAHLGHREMVVQLWYPSATARGRRAKYRKKAETTRRSSYQAVLATHSLEETPLAAGRFPIIVHNPGWHGWAQRGTFLAQDLASHGFVVAAISHPYNSSFVQLSDGTLAEPDYGLDIGWSTQHYIPLQERLRLAEEELEIQTLDCRLVLNELQRLDLTPGHPFESHLVTDWVGTYGYSFGGAVSAEFAKEDSRVRAVLGLDAVLHGATATDGLNRPLMLIDAPVTSQFAQGESPADGVESSWRTVAYEDSKRMWKSIAEAKARVLANHGGYRVFIKGLGHDDFTDQIFMSPLRRFSYRGALPPKRVASILSTYALAFFRQTLLDMPSPLLSEESQPFPEATLQVWHHGRSTVGESRIISGD